MGHVGSWDVTKRQLATKSERLTVGVSSKGHELDIKDVYDTRL